MYISVNTYEYVHIGICMRGTEYLVGAGNKAIISDTCVHCINIIQYMYIYTRYVDYTEVRRGELLNYWIHIEGLSTCL